MSDRRLPELSRRNFLALAGSMSIANGYAWPQALLKTLSQEKAPILPVVVRGNARFKILSPTVLRLEYSPTGHFIDAPSVSVLNRSWPACPFDAKDANGWVEIATSQMRMKYKLDSGKFTAENLAVNWTDINGEHLWKPGDVDDKNLGGVPGAPDGLGILPKTPGALSRNGYFWLDDSATAVWEAATEWPQPRPNREEALDWYFFTYGRDYKAILRELAQLLGPVPMVPRYVFGVWLTDRCGYSSDEWQRIVYRFREEGIPLDMVVMDSLTATAMIWRGFDFDPEQIPDPPAYFAWMKAHGIKVSANEHYSPITPQSDRHFDQVRRAMGLPADTKEIKHDLADKKYAQLYMDVLHKPSLDMGLAFWWQDGNAKCSMPGLDETLWTRHIEYEGQERITGKRTVIFCRLRSYGSAAPPVWGVHRYGGFFTGDISPSWSTWGDMLVPFNVQSGNILVPLVTNDVPPGAGPTVMDHEWYTRGLQFATFSPIFRWHSGWGMRLPWEYGEDGYALVKQFHILRYRLLPYVYTYARLAHETGTPLVRGTYLEYPEQEPAYTFTQQYLFGQELLVAPITLPGRGQAVRKAIYLPEGEYWFDYFTGKIYTGGQVLSYECPLDRIPVFVKAGSIMPMAPRMDYSDQRPIDPLIVHVYAGKPATFRLYEDDGMSLDYRKAAYAWTLIKYLPASGEHVITIGGTEGLYHGQLQARRHRIHIHGLVRPARVQVHGRLLSEKPAEDAAAEGWSWDQAEQLTVIDLIRPVSIRDAVTVTVEGAGDFLDAVAVQAARDYRARVRRVRDIQQLRWAMVVGGYMPKKVPRALRETEAVEQTLNDLLDHPAGLVAHAADFKGMTATILAAFLNQPFDSTRTLPEPDPEAAQGIKAIANATFTEDNLHRMTAELLACDLEASVTDGIIHVRFLYDTASIGPPQLDYDLKFPNDGPPGWAESTREAQPDGSLKITLSAPYPSVPGPHPMQLRVTANWGPNQTVVEREVVWTIRS